MKTSRRAFLKTTAALPAAAAIAGSAVAPAVEAATAAPLAPAYPWQWWVSLDGGENFFECVTSRDEALKVALDYGGGIIAECQQGDFHMEVDGDQILEILYGQNEDLTNEDGEFLDYTPEQERDLGKMVSETIDAWVRKHKISTTSYKFDGVRNKAKVAEDGSIENNI